MTLGLRGRYSFITDTILKVDTSAEADASLKNKEVNIWLDETGNNLVFKVKFSDGTIKSGTVALTT